MKLAIASVLCLLAKDALAGYSYSITNPVKGTAWQFGQRAVVKWLSPSNDGPNPSTVDVVLMVGVDPNTKDVSTLSSGVSPTAGEVSFDVPNVEQGDKYFIKIGSAAEKDFRYSHFFAINGGKPTGLNASSGGAAANSSSSSSSSPSSSSSKSASGSSPTGGSTDVSTSAAQTMTVATYSAIIGSLVAFYYSSQ
jgi:hypothetical protein